MMQHTPPKTSQLEKENQASSISETDQEANANVNSRRVKRRAIRSPELVNSFKLEGTLNTFQQQITEQITQLFATFQQDQNVKFATLKTDLQDIKQEILEFKNFKEKTNTEISVLSADIEKLSTKSTKIEKNQETSMQNMEMLERKLESVERQLCQYKLEIRNVPPTIESKEELQRIVNNLLDKLNLSSINKEIRSIKRLPGKPNTSRPILLEVNSTESKTTILQGVKRYNKANNNNKLNSSQLDISGPSMPIYVSDHLTFKAKSLFYKARQYAKQNKFTHCWTANGQVCLRKEDGSEIIYVKNEQQLQEIVHAYVVGAVAAAGVVGGAYAAFRMYKRIQATKLPQKWNLVGTLQDIYVYPVKSCGGVKLDRAECTILGLRSGWLRDRVLMITDAQSNFITARAYPELLTIATKVKNTVLTLTHGDLEPLSVNLAEIVESGNTPKTAHVWGVPVPVYDCGWEASEWISRCINKTTGDFRLVYYASHKARQMRSTNPTFYKFRKTDTGALPDEVPFNLINEASVKDLNDKLEDKVSHRNFRPNFTLNALDGIKAFEEDEYRFVKIADNIFEIIKPCGRCVLTTIDPETGVRNSKTEPLKTLKSYRQYVNPAERRLAGASPRMGIQMALRSGPGGLVSLNDPIYFGN